MPSYEEVTQCAGSVCARTGVTEAALTALLPHVAPACVTSLPGPAHGWAPPHEPPLPYVGDLSLTHDGRHAALHPDLLETAPHPSRARTTRGQVSIARTWRHLLPPVLHQA